MTRIGLCMAVATLALVVLPAAQSARKLTRPSDVTPHSEAFRPASTGAAIDDCECLYSAHRSLYLSIDLLKDAT